MILIKDILLTVGTGWLHMFENRPWNGVADALKFCYTLAFFKITCIILTCTLLYYVIIVKMSSRHLYVIAYIRLITGEKNVDGVVDIYNAILFLGVIFWTMTPLNFYFRPTATQEFDEYEDQYAIKHLKKILKKDYEVFREYLQLYQEVRYSRYNEEAKELMYDHMEPDEDDDLALSVIFWEHNALQTLFKTQYYLYFDHILKDIVGDSVNCLLDVPPGAEEPVQNAQDMEDLVALFCDTYLYKYLPYRMLWIPSAANANADICGIHYSAELQYPYDDKEIDAIVWADYKAKEPFYEYTYYTEEYWDDIPEHMLYMLEEWRFHPHSWENYHLVAAEDMADWDFVTPFDLDKGDSREALDEFSFSTYNFQRLDTKWRKWRKRRFNYKSRFESFFRYFPMAVTFAHGTPNDLMYKDQWRRFLISDVEYFKPGNMHFYDSTYTLSEVNLFSNIPDWYAERIPYKFIDPYTEWHVKPWKIRRSHYAKPYMHNTWGWWRFRQERDISSRNYLTYWLNPWARLQDFYVASFLWNNIDDENHDEPIEIHDGDSPHNMPLVDFLTDWYYEFDEYVDGFTPPNIFYEWPYMTDSSFAYKLTTYGQKDEAVLGSTIKCDDVLVTYFDHNLFDFSARGQLGFQDSASPTMEGIIDLHHDLMFFLTIIVVYIVWLLAAMIWNFYVFDDEGQEIDNVLLIPSLKVFNVMLEVIWTIVPCLILLMVAIPSFALIYSMDELLAPRLTMKILGHQWYWSYEYNHLVKSDTGNFLTAKKQFDSNMLLDEDLVPGQLRLLEVNKRTYLPSNMNVRLLVSAVDVLHSWAVPSLGVKADACPGRLNQVPLFIKRLGVFYGQCSELCGVNHAFMPVVVQGVSPDEYGEWFNEGVSCEVKGYVRRFVLWGGTEEIFNNFGVGPEYLKELHQTVCVINDLFLLLDLEGALPRNVFYALIKTPEGHALAEQFAAVHLHDKGITIEDRLKTQIILQAPLIFLQDYLYAMKLTCHALRSGVMVTH